MNKERIREELQEIEVPMTDIFTAIDKGIKRGRQYSGSKPKRKMKICMSILSSVVIFFLAAGFVFAPLSYALSYIPLLGSIYDKVGLQIGYELLESDLVAQLDKTASSNGIYITITSAYFDGNVIGVTFRANGEKVSLDYDGNHAPEVGYGFHLFDGKEQSQWESTMTQLTKTKDGYVASIEFYDPDLYLTDDYTLPLTFNNITGVKGIWKFDVPVEKIPSEIIRSEAKSKQNDYSLKMKSIVKGKATTIFNYQTIFPLTGENDEIRISVSDNIGNRLAKFNPRVLQSKVGKKSVVKENQELFSSGISEDAKYLIIQPEIVKGDKDVVKTLNQLTPFYVESERFEYAIKVNKMEREGQTVILDYNIKNVEKGSIREDILQNFADFIMLIDSNRIQKDERGELDIEKMLKYKIRSDQARLINQNTLHYQSTFHVKDKQQFKIEDYSVVVPFGTLSANEEPIQMDPIRIELE
ncbi:DUF4179 domain-containing protein [Radiobacillus deserti]|uniref:DUF4179 domain-containing protein n=1 Tax=Radiobacillus deserti TaxID=2594883 RepID=A0A516KIA2_9BACI|nr:DUF4179 domain-containing protein [Radiobacillus deserti]QDP41128.1 DUF4179 domain-containing protein [Radiobacillus deserti]